MQPNQFAPVEAEDAARLSQNEKFEADAGPYAFTGERPFVSVMSRPRSSVPLVVNSASYLDVRRSIDAGLLPPRESVRIEGMINHFPYEYPQPTAGGPFSLNLDVVTCPWEPTHRLVRIGLKGHQDVAVRADSRIEVEFNPRRVASYRLIGYDRQKTETQNSNEDNVGSHPLAAGYTLTTLYEVVPLKRVGTAPHTQMPTVAEEASEPLLTAKLQLKTRGNDAAVGLIQRTLSDSGFDFAAAPSDLKFAAAVAEFGMILRDSEYKGNATIQQVTRMGRGRKGRRYQWLPRRFHRACAQGTDAQKELNIFSCFCCGDGLGAHCKEGTDKQNAGAPKLGVRESFAIEPGRQRHRDGRAKELEALR